jgi:adenylate cyclase
MSHSVTATQIRIEQDHADQLVRAQSALIGERAVAITRLALMLMLGLATGGIGHATGKALPQSPYRFTMVAFYLVMSVGAVVFTQRAKSSEPRKALVIPILFTFLDAGFFLGHAFIDKSLGITPRPEIVTVAYAVLICYSVARFRLLHVVLSTSVSIVCVVSIGLLEDWAHPIWMSFTCACLLALGILIGFTNYRIRSMFVDIRRRENLSRFLPKQVVDRVLAAGGNALHPVQREVTILFSDIRDFTTMSETLQPKEVLEFLDEYFGHMAQIVKGHDGMLNKFLGDGMLAVWGVPDIQDDHAVRALRAAIDMRKKMLELNEIRQREGKPTFRIGIGVHTGVVAAGMLGGADQREYTVIGDAVNLASRIEGLTKTCKTDILASETTWRQGGAKFKGERVGEEHVKGRDALVVVYAVREGA